MADQSGNSRKKSRECQSSSSKKLLVVEDADRLNRLPQEIQSEILSFLPIIDAAKVGLMSRMWRSTRCSLSKLAFDYYKFPEMENKMDSIVKFIDQTLAHHDESSVKIFELHLFPLVYYDIPIKTEWITFAIQHNVEKLVLYGEIKNLPYCIFSCQSLVKLELALEELILNFPQTVSLPNLRKLKLKYLVLYEPGLSQDPFSRFPALEKLSIFNCTILHPKVFFVSSSNLTYFTMCSCVRTGSCSVRLQAPSLSKFIYISDDLEPTVLEIPRHGFELIIDGEDAYTKSNSTYDLGQSAIQVTRDLLRSKFIAVNHWLIEYLCTVHDLSRQMSFGLFHDLMNLDMSLWPTMEHIKVLMVLLSRCPKLSKLSLRIVPSRREARQLPDVNFLVDFDTGGGFRSLTHISIGNFGGDEIERLLVRFLLATASELRLLRIVMNGFMASTGIRLKISEILGYEKSSPYADVIFD